MRLFYIMLDYLRNKQLIETQQLHFQIMEQLKQYVDEGQIQIAKLDGKNQPHKVPYSQLADQVSRQQRNVSLYKSLQQLSWDEKFEWVNLKRLKAKQFFKEGNYNQAIETYTQALVGIDLNDKTEGRLEQMKNQLQYPIALNIATCLYKKKENKRAIEVIDKILKQNENFLDAIYKKAYLLINCGQFPEAKQLINRGIKIANEQKKQEDLKDFIQLNGQLLKAGKENKNIYAKMFNQQIETQDGENSESSSLVSKKEQKQNKEDGQEEVLYHDDWTNICGKVSRFFKKIVYFIVPSQRPNKKRDHIQHSKSF